jgi:hypothetical protein
VDIKKASAATRRGALLCCGFAVASFVAAAIAGFFGAMINKYAPVQCGRTTYPGWFQHLSARDHS